MCEGDERLVRNFKQSARVPRANLWITCKWLSEKAQYRKPPVSEKTSSR
jgi:hypothetical protein